MSATKFGVINEDYLTLRSPRGIDSDECESLGHAFAAAHQMILNGAEQVAIVRCRYSKKHECWVEIVDGQTIQIDAGSFKLDEDEELAS